MNAETRIKAQDNLRIWNVLGRTDPAHTKQFQRSGGFRGTALKPIWVERRLTELFGPCGIGWGTDEPTFRIVEAGDEMLVYATVHGWYVEDGVKASVYGIGGDKIVSMTKNGPKADDEAFKKAGTDAIGNAFKHVGVGADIHMGQFEDNKYVQETAQEFIEEEQAAPQKVPGISNIKKRLNKLMMDGNAATDLASFNALVGECKEELTAIKEANHDYWTGDGGDEHEGFKKWIVRRRAELTPPDASDLFRDLVDSLNQCDTQDAMESLVDMRADSIADLDGEESRKFTKLFDYRSGVLKGGKVPLIPSEAK